MLLASDSFSSSVFSFSQVSVCVYDPNKLLDGNVRWFGKWKLKGGGSGSCDGKIWLDGGGGGGGDGKFKGKDDNGGGGEHLHRSQFYHRRQNQRNCWHYLPIFYKIYPHN